jgi:hypothetical protein
VGFPARDLLGILLVLEILRLLCTYCSWFTQPWPPFPPHPEAEFLDDPIQKKVLRVSSLLFTVTSYRFALIFKFFQNHATSYSFYSLITVHCKRERRKTL